MRIAQKGSRPECLYTRGSIGDLLDLCGVMRWPAGLLYAPRGDEEAGGGPRERHIAAENTPPRNRPLLDDGLRDLGVRVTDLVQRAASERSDACWCCELPANALLLPLYILVVELRQYIHTLRSGLCILYSCTVSTTAAPTFSPLLLLHMYIYYVCVCVCVCVCPLP